MNLIIVDDNPDFREALKNYAEMELKHTVIAEASSGEEFLRLKNITQADIILMDLRMEYIDGFEATSNILWHYPKINLIAITNDTQRATLTRLIEAGFKGFISKSDVFSILKETLILVYSGKYAFNNNLML